MNKEYILVIEVWADTFSYDGKYRVNRFYQGELNTEKIKEILAYESDVANDYAKRCEGCWRTTLLNIIEVK